MAGGGLGARAEALRPPGTCLGGRVGVCGRVSVCEGGSEGVSEEEEEEGRELEEEKRKRE